MKIGFVFTCSIMLMASRFAFADLTMRTVETSSGASTTGTIYVSDSKISARDESGNSSFIFYSDESRFLGLQHDDKRYVEMDMASIKKMGQQIDSARQQAMKMMQERLKNMPPEQRAAMEKMMQERMPQAQELSKTELKETGKSKTVNGQSCQLVEVLEQGKVINTACMADYRKLGIEADDYRTVNAFFSAMQQFSQQFGNQNELALSDAMFEKGWVPLSFTNIKQGKPEVIVSYSNQPVSAEHFAIPSGYSKQEMRFPGQ